MARSRIQTGYCYARHDRAAERENRMRPQNEMGLKEYMYCCLPGTLRKVDLYSALSRKLMLLSSSQDHLARRLSVATGASKRTRRLSGGGKGHREVGTRFTLTDIGSLQSGRELLGQHLKGWECKQRVAAGDVGVF